MTTEPTTEKVSIDGLDKGDVLAALYDASHPQGLGIIHFDPAPMTREQAREIIERFAGELYFDYVGGRVLKVDLQGDEFDPWGYDRDNGKGSAAAVIAALRAGS